MLPSMATPPADSERRSHPRYAAGSIKVSLRPRGALSKFSAELLDFNRHGLAVRFDRPMPKDKLVFLSLHCADLHLDQVVGVIHNCFAQEDGYRCGIRFRTQSALQFDREQVESVLLDFESLLTDFRKIAAQG